MKKTRKVIAMVLVLALPVAMSVAGTIAYLTDKDEKVNTFTVGNIQIEQNEKDREGNDFEDQKIFPIVNDKVEDGYHMGNNYVDKIVTVTNTGTEAAYIRTYLAVPAALDDGPTTFDASLNVLHWNGASASDENSAADQNMQNDWYWTGSLEVGEDWPGVWDGYVTEIEGVTYNVYVATHKSEVASGATTAPSLLGVYLDKSVDYDAEAKSYFYEKNDEVIYIDYDLSQPIKVLVLSEAVQSAGFDNAIDALEEAFGEVGTYCPFGGKLVAQY